MKRIGIVGGTFDPIHYGHLMLGRQAYEEYGLDEVWYMPSRQPPHKKDHPITSGNDRVAMIQLAIAGIPYFSLSDFELKRKTGNTYTADTLTLLAKEYPDTEFFFIVGADSIYEIEHWYHPEVVLRSATILAAKREYDDERLTLEQQISYLQEKYGARIFELHCREFSAASAQVRTMMANGHSVDELIPAPVEQYILEHSLYKDQITGTSGAGGPGTVHCGQRCHRKGKGTMNEDIFAIRDRLKSKLNPMRYEHTLSVSFTCMALAMRYGCDMEKAEMAGLLHDCAKRYDDETIIKKCRKHGIELTESERMAPSIIHAKLGAWMAEHKYGVTDSEILSAIACHTTGKPDMSLLDKILYIADFIEPRRDRVSSLPQMRRLAFVDLDEALFQIMEGILQYLENSGVYADDMTRQAYEYYRALRTAKQEPMIEKDAVDTVSKDAESRQQEKEQINGREQTAEKSGSQPSGTGSFKRNGKDRRQGARRKKRGRH